MEIALFNLLNDIYATFHSPSQHKTQRLPTEAFSLLVSGLNIKRLVAVDAGGNTELRITDDSDVGGKRIELTIPKEWSLPVAARALLSSLDTKTWKNCRSPGGGLVCAAAHLALSNDTISTYWFNDAQGKATKTVNKADNGMWDICLGHIPSKPGSHRGLPKIGSCTYGPIGVSVLDEVVYGYFVDVGDPHFIVFAGPDSPHVGSSSTRVGSVLRHYWDEHLLATDAPLLIGHQAAENVRLDLLWRLGRMISEAFVVDIPPDTNIAIVNFKRDRLEMEYRAFDGAIGAPVNGSVNSAVAIVAAAVDLGLADGNHTIVGSSALEYYRKSWAESVVEDILVVRFDVESGWHVRTVCNLLMKGYR